MNEFLQLKTLTVIKEYTDETMGDIHILTKMTNPPNCCQKCGIVKLKRLQKFSKKRFTFMDIPVRNHRVGIHIERQRYRCLECGATFWEDLPEMHTVHRATNRLVEFIRGESLKRTFTSIADDVGISEPVVRRIFKEHVAELEAKHIFEIPRWIGVDEKHILSTPRFIITNIEERSIIDILPKRTADVISAYFMKMKGKRNIEWVTMDMWSGYRSVVRKLIPDARIVVDKYHVLQEVNRALDQVRIAIGRTLTDSQKKRLMRSRFLLLKRKHRLTEEEVIKRDQWLSNFPILHDAYWLKEWFYDFWDCQSRKEAEEQFAIWEQLVPPSVAPYFEKISTSMHNWGEDIFNYFDCGLTNAYTESLNAVIGATNIKGRGYSFEALRAKILFHEGVHKEPKPKFNKNVKDMMRSVVQLRASAYRRMGLIYSYGADISTLAQLMADGNF